MPIKPVRIEAFWYTPRSERNEEEQPVADATQFQLKPLSGIELQDVYVDTKTDPEGNVIFSSNALKAALSKGFVGWKNFGDEQGEVAFNPRANGANLQYLDFTLATELAVAVLESSQVREDGRKKS